jgi:hypothetical protein
MSSSRAALQFVLSRTKQRPDSRIEMTTASTSISKRSGKRPFAKLKSWAETNSPGEPTGARKSFRLPCISMILTASSGPRFPRFLSTPFNLLTVTDLSYISNPTQIRTVYCYRHETNLCKAHLTGLRILASLSGDFPKRSRRSTLELKTAG